MKNRLLILSNNMGHLEADVLAQAIDEWLADSEASSLVIPVGIIPDASLDLHVFVVMQGESGEIIDVREITMPKMEFEDVSDS